MTTLTVEAIYQDGVLKPTVELDLPENTPVTIILSPHADPQLENGSASHFALLRGLWSEVQFPPSTEIVLQQARALTNTKLELLAKELTNG